MSGPDFIIGGARRSGSTSLWHWLKAHPEIAMASSKEIRFFSHHYDQGISWYLHQFPTSFDGMRGEASPTYLSHPDAATRIAHDLPAVRMLFSLREPAERAYSHYWMNRHRRRVTGTFEEVLANPAHHEYLSEGYYATHLRRFYDRLGARNVKVLLFEDLTARPQQVFTEICEFLEITAQVPDVVGSTVNAQVAFRSIWIRDKARRLPDPWQRIVGRLNTRPARIPPMRAATRQELRARYAPHNRELAELLGRDPGW